MVGYKMVRVRPCHISTSLHPSEASTHTPQCWVFFQLGPKGPSKIIRGFADIRWHQTADVGYVPNPRMKNVFMGTAVDDADFTSPHGP